MPGGGGWIGLLVAVIGKATSNSATLDRATSSSNTLGKAISNSTTLGKATSSSNTALLRTRTFAPHVDTRWP